MAGKAGPEDVREKLIGEREVARVLPVVRDIGFLILRVDQVVAIRRRTGNTPPPVHRAAGEIRERAIVGVAQIARRAVRCARRREHAVRGWNLRDAFGAGKRSEVIVERVVLFHDDHDVLDRNLHGGRVYERRRRILRSSAAARARVARCGRAWRGASSDQREYGESLSGRHTRMIHEHARRAQAKAQCAKAAQRQDERTLKARLQLFGCTGTTIGLVAHLVGIRQHEHGHG